MYVSDMRPPGRLNVEYQTMILCVAVKKDGLL